jgi:hypothetical protein
MFAGKSSGESHPSICFLKETHVTPHENAQNFLKQQQGVVFLLARASKTKQHLEIIRANSLLNHYWTNCCITQPC